MHAVYNVSMAIKNSSHRISVTLTLDEYNHVLRRVSEVKKAGYKWTASKYIAMAVRNQRVTDEMFKERYHEAATK